MEGCASDNNTGSTGVPLSAGSIGMSSRVVVGERIGSGMSGVSESLGGKARPLICRRCRR